VDAVIAFVARSVGEPWIQRRRQDDEEEQPRTKSYDQPDQDRGF
jgi:hypothetical protein